jgi:5'-3' exonuclease
MGITGLLPLLSSISVPIHVSEYNGTKVAVDGYCWLHRAAYSCSSELCQNVPTDRYIQFCLNRVNLLRSHNITPVLVFDGGHLPMKKGQEEIRGRKRKEHLAKAKEFLKQGNRTAAQESFKKAVDITPLMAHRLIKVLQSEGIECIVAPYEADAQLAFLSHAGYVHAIISEDSDLLPYGCNRVLFKMDAVGHGKEIKLQDLGANTGLRFHNFTLDMFRQMCILSGCDYLPSIPGLGLKKAHSLLYKYRTMSRVFRFLRADRRYVVPQGYEEAFTKAEQTFLHQSVFDPINKRVVPLTPFPPHLSLSETSFLGPYIEPEIACEIAVGNLDPNTHQPFPQEEVLTERENKETANTFGSMGSTCRQRSRSLNNLRDESFLAASKGGGLARGMRKERTTNNLRKPLLFPAHRNTLSSYFTPSTNGSIRAFVPPRASQDQIGRTDQPAQSASVKPSPNVPAYHIHQVEQGSAPSLPSYLSPEAEPDPQPAGREAYVLPVEAPPLRLSLDVGVEAHGGVDVALGLGVGMGVDVDVGVDLAVGGVPHSPRTRQPKVLVSRTPSPLRSPKRKRSERLPLLKNCETSRAVHLIVTSKYFAQEASPAYGPDEEGTESITESDEEDIGTSSTTTGSAPELLSCEQRESDIERREMIDLTREDSPPHFDSPLVATQRLSTAPTMQAKRARIACPPLKRDRSLLAYFSRRSQNCSAATSSPSYPRPTTPRATLQHGKEPNLEQDGVEVITSPYFNTKSPF